MNRLHHHRRHLTDRRSHFPRHLRQTDPALLRRLTVDPVNHLPLPYHLSHQEGYLHFRYHLFHPICHLHSRNHLFHSRYRDRHHCLQDRFHYCYHLHPPPACSHCPYFHYRLPGHFPNPLLRLQSRRCSHLSVQEYYTPPPVSSESFSPVRPSVISLAALVSY